MTAEHRCEIRPDDIPGPGHQLGYCLGANHTSCPQLRAYEGRRHAAVPAAPSVGGPPVQGPWPARAAVPFLSPSAGEFGATTGAPGRRSATLNRFGWAAVGAIGALAIVAGLTLYAAPENLTADTGAQPSSAVTAVIPSPEVATPTEVAAPTSTPGASAASSNRAEAPPQPTATVDPPQPATYIVQPGDTLGQIARDLGVSPAALAAANGITEDAVLLAGQELLVPAAGPPSDSAPTATPSVDR